MAAQPFTLLVDLHVKFIQSLDTVRASHHSPAAELTPHESTQKRNDLAYYFTEHLRMNGIYWGLTALALMGHTDALPKDDLLEWVMSCWDAQIGPPWPRVYTTFLF
jgi:geranylgeranyl transferase type-2 subunit beta